VLLALRVSMPDRPGMLARLATTLAEAGADIASVEVIEKTAGMVIDEMVVSLDGSDPIALSRHLQAVPGLVVESVRDVDQVPSATALLELASALVQARSRRLEILVEGAPGALRGAWALVVSARTGRARVLSASTGAPRLTDERLPWLPLEQPRRLAAAGWMPTSWRMRAALGGLELAAWPLGRPDQALLVGRYSGLRFRLPELRQMELIVSVADADGALAQELEPRLSSSRP
jgi:hypothetical protein